MQSIYDHGGGWWVDDGYIIPCTKSSKRKYAQQMIVLHWTAAPYKSGTGNLGRIKRWAANTDDKSSTHFVILRGGEIYQLVSTDLVAWHAGKSEWTLSTGKHVTSCNNYSLGIDYDNVGPLTLKDGKYYDSYGGEHHGAAVECDGKWYEPISDAQIWACRVLCDALRSKYSIPLQDIVGHRDVSPGRKIDPGPLGDPSQLGWY